MKPKLRELRVITLRIASFFLFFMVLVSCTPVRKADPEEEVIKSVREFSNQSIAKRDTAAIASTLTKDFHGITSRNQAVIGSHGMARRFAEDFKLRPDVSYVRTPLSIRIYQPWNTASERGSWVGKWNDTDGPVEISGIYYAKWVRVSGKWIIRAEMFTPRKCTGGKYCVEPPL